MKIVRRKEFLALPVGTVFSRYEPCAFTDFLIKGESITNDWFEVSIERSGAHGAEEDFGREGQSGASFPVDLDCEGRDGLYAEDDALYAVWEKTDVEALIARLQLALTGESVYTIEAKKRKPT